MGNPAALSQTTGDSAGVKHLCALDPLLLAWNVLPSAHTLFECSLVTNRCRARCQAWGACALPDSDSGEAGHLSHEPTEPPKRLQKQLPESWGHGIVRGSQGR